MREVQAEKEKGEETGVDSERWVVGDDKESQIKPLGRKRVAERGDQSR